MSFQLDIKKEGLASFFNSLVKDLEVKERPDTLTDRHLIAIVSAMVTAASNSKIPQNELAFYGAIERQLDIFKSRITIEEYVYVSKMMESLTEHLVAPKESQTPQSHYS